MNVIIRSKTQRRLVCASITKKPFIILYRTVFVGSGIMIWLSQYNTTTHHHLWSSFIHIMLVFVMSELCNGRHLALKTVACLNLSSLVAGLHSLILLRWLIELTAHHRPFITRDEARSRRSAIITSLLHSNHFHECLILIRMFYWQYIYGHGDPPSLLQISRPKYS